LLSAQGVAFSAPVPDHQDDFRGSSMKIFRPVLACALLSSAPALALDVSKAPYGTTGDGKPVQIFTLTNDHGMSAKVLDLGAYITEINVPGRDGKTANVVLGFGDLPAWERAGSWNSLVGRYANRLMHGFTLDGRHYDLAAAPSGVTLHSGRPSYASRVLASQTFKKADSAGVILTLVSPDGDQGFPGQVTIQVTYSITNDNDFRIDYHAVTDKPTVINLTNHIYFNMAGNGSGTVEHQMLQVMADQYSPTDALQIPTGESAPVAGTALDFRNPKPIGRDIRSSEPQMVIGHGYDHNFILRHARPGSLDLAAVLYDPASGRELQLSTTQPGVQVYSANNVNGTMVSAAGTTIRQTDGLALETEHFPDSPNHPDFPSTVLRPGQTFTSTTQFHFSVR
jgi:aldose 1-epimerase